MHDYTGQIRLRKITHHEQEGMQPLLVKVKVGCKAHDNEDTNHGHARCTHPATFLASEGSLKKAFVSTRCTW